MSLKKTILELGNFFGIGNLEIISQKLIESPPKNLKCVYILISPENEVAYVGKGNLSARLGKHRSKLRGKADYYPNGWGIYKKGISEDDLSFWVILYIKGLNYEAERTAIEGGLIYHLKPNFNVEVYIDKNCKNQN